MAENKSKTADFLDDFENIFDDETPQAVVKALKPESDGKAVKSDKVENVVVDSAKGDNKSNEGKNSDAIASDSKKSDKAENVGKTSVKSSSRGRKKVVKKSESSVVANKKNSKSVLSTEGSKFTSIRMVDSTVKKLAFIKLMEGHSSLDAVIDHLIQNYQPADKQAGDLLKSM